MVAPAYRRVLVLGAGVPPRDRTAELPGRVYAIVGDKHFGSGLGILDWMVTTAVPAGEEAPAIFALRVSDVPWDGSAGLSLTAEWDGSGMAATQSHAVRLDGIPAVRFAHRAPLAEIALAANPLVLTLFTSLVAGIIDEAVAFARDQLRGRAAELRAYERVQWTRVERLHWLADQAVVGSIVAVESGDATIGLHGALRAKQSVAELAEEIMTLLGRVIGGGSFSFRSPIARWSADVRALGFLRPPWGLAEDQLYDTSW